MRGSLRQFARAAAVVAAAAAPRASALEPQGEIDRAERDLKVVEERLVLVENAYAFRIEPPEEEEIKKRFSDAEIQFLLGNYQPGSVLLYDLIGNPIFRRMPQFGEALYLLGESLFQLQNYLGARIYFRDYMNLDGGDRHYNESMARYLDISGRLNEFTGVERFLQRAKDAQGGIPADLAYVYAKWTYKRGDLAREKRHGIARDTFVQIAALGAANALQSQYYVGVIAVQQGDLNAATVEFDRVLRMTARAAADRRIQELANLSLGRVLYELGRYPEALDRYQEIDRDSDYFNEALYEIAWTYVKKREYAKASRACEFLIPPLAPETTLSPEAQILQGHLLLKLQKFNEATETYNVVINQYAPVRDEIDALLSVHRDPVKYFDELLARNDRAFDVTSLLPAIAVKWATTQREVAQAVQLVGDLNLARVGVDDSRDIAKRLLTTLDRRGIDVFPTLAEGYAKAELADSSLSGVEESLIAVEETVAGATATDIQGELAQVIAERHALEARFRAIPKTEAELEERKNRMGDRLGALKTDLFKLSLTLDSYFAILTAVEKWVNDTRAERKDPQEERELLSEIRGVREVVLQLRVEHQRQTKLIREESSRLNSARGDEERIRNDYQKALEREREILARARGAVAPDGQKFLARVDLLRARAASMRSRSEKAKDAIRQVMRRKAETIRQRVAAEAALLDAYDNEVAAVSGDARNLVGRITYASFRRVRREFYDLVLKADVGLVDVAWSRKMDKTNQIQNLAKQKDRELKALDEDFKEVRKDIE